MPDGKDSLGNWINVGNATCGVCRKGTRSCIRYTDKPAVSAYVAKARSLLIRNKKTGDFIRTIGISCGCYAKVHRQIAHIAGGRRTIAEEQEESARHV